jgi:hypothetical protein
VCGGAAVLSPTEWRPLVGHCDLRSEIQARSKEQRGKRQAPQVIRIDPLTSVSWPVSQPVSRNWLGKGGGLSVGLASTGLLVRCALLTGPPLLAANLARQGKG